MQGAGSGGSGSGRSWVDRRRQPGGRPDRQEPALPDAHDGQVPDVQVHDVQVPDVQVHDVQVHEVLVLEDSRTHATIVSRMLDVRSPVAQEVFGTYRVTVCATVAAAVAHLARGGVDVVLCDLHVPDSSGVDTVHALRGAAPDLHNRRGFFRAAARLHDAASAGRQQLLAAFLDLNDLKVLNDTCGHAAGDEAIAGLAAALAGAVPEGGVVGRLGGDELAALLLCEGTAERFADRLDGAIAAINAQRGMPVRTSLGTAVADARSTALDDLLRAADADLYAAKARKAAEPGAVVRSTA
jgi:diguanylate cyclase (GGDEF)-like protein